MSTCVTRRSNSEIRVQTRLQRRHNTFSRDTLVTDISDTNELGKRFRFLQVSPPPTFVPCDKFTSRSDQSDLAAEKQSIQQTRVYCSVYSDTEIVGAQVSIYVECRLATPRTNKTRLNTRMREEKDYTNLHVKIKLRGQLLLRSNVCFPRRIFNLCFVYFIHSPQIIGEPIK